MPAFDLDDTIAAISTPLGVGGLGIVRISGPRALGIAKKLFRTKKKGASLLPRRATLGYVLGPDGRELDEAFLTYFPASGSYTRENVVELSCHGNPAVLEEIVRLIVKAGARHAHPGEFTLRAYLHGRIDVLQAEAVQSLISSTSLTQARISFSQLEGRLSSKLASLRDKIIRLMAGIEARIEFPEDELEPSGLDVEGPLAESLDYVTRLIESYEWGRALAEGVTLAIVGRTNVGKSTLFNALAEKERAIVTPFPGTTRDYLCEMIRIEDVLFRIVDMAGWGRAVHPAEKEGIRRGREMAMASEGVLLLLDASRRETLADLALLNEYRHKKTLVLFNKSDLRPKIDRERIKSKAPGARFLDISALKGTNLGLLKRKIQSMFVPSGGPGEEVILHSRQKALLDQVQGHLRTGLALHREGHPDEIMAEEIRNVIPLIGQLTGELRVEEVVKSIFERFCIGK